MTNDLKVWQYWEGPMPEYIKLCLQSARRVCDKSGVCHIIVTPQTINSFLPKETLPRRFYEIKQAGPRADIVRAALLATYGGWWWDADTIALRDPSSIAIDADVLYMTWTKPPVRVLNGYIYVHPGCKAGRDWLAGIHSVLENGGSADWLELGEKIITPLFYGGGSCQMIDRALFLPIDIDSDVERFFQPGDPWRCVTDQTVCFGLNHSWFMYHKRDCMEMPQEQWKTSNLLIHQLLSAIA